jgi:hypothetical protein
VGELVVEQPNVTIDSDTARDAIAKRESIFKRCISIVLPVRVCEKSVAGHDTCRKVDGLAQVATPKTSRIVSMLW